jgi:predicted RecB family nuclease
VQLIDGRPVFAATDLVAYLACEHLTQLERAALADLVKRPMRDDPELDIIRKRGFQHEKRYLADLQAAGRDTVEIQLDGSIEDRGDQLRAAAAETIAAMASGADVIYQATFFDGTWRGHADFLLRVEDPEQASVWGPYHYEVADTKLARHVKASAVLQICSYIDQLTRIQGVQPEWLHVALGGSARTVEKLRVDDYMAYYRSARDRFLATMADETPATYPPARTATSAAGRPSASSVAAMTTTSASSPASAAGSGRRSPIAMSRRSKASAILPSPCRRGSRASARGR